MVSFFLPMSCGLSENFYPWKLIFTNGEPGKTSDFHPLIICYLWPIPFLLLHKASKSKLGNFLLTSAEIFFCLLAFYLILLVAIFGYRREMSYGGYIYLISISVYSLVCFFVLSTILIGLLRKRKPYQ